MCQVGLGPFCEYQRWIFKTIENYYGTNPKEAIFFKGVSGRGGAYIHIEHNRRIYYQRQFISYQLISVLINVKD